MKIQVKSTRHDLVQDQLLFRYEDPGKGFGSQKPLVEDPADLLEWHGVKPTLVIYRVTRITWNGAWIEPSAWTWQKPRWMQAPAIRPFAHQDPIEALKSWKIRKIRELDHCLTRYERAKRLVGSFDPAWAENPWHGEDAACLKL